MPFANSRASCGCPSSKQPTTTTSWARARFLWCGSRGNADAARKASRNSSSWNGCSGCTKGTGEALVAGAACARGGAGAAARFSEQAGANSNAAGRSQKAAGRNDEAAERQQQDERNLDMTDRLTRG